MDFVVTTTKLEILGGVGKLSGDKAIILTKAEFLQTRMHHLRIHRLARRKLELFGPGPRRIERRLPLILEIERIDGHEAQSLGRFFENGGNEITGFSPNPGVDAFDDLRIGEVVDQHIGAGPREREKRQLPRPGRPVEGQEIGKRERPILIASILATASDQRGDHGPEGFQVTVSPASGGVPISESPMQGGPHRLARTQIDKRQDGRQARGRDDQVGIGAGLALAREDADQILAQPHLRRQQAVAAGTPSITRAGFKNVRKRGPIEEPEQRAKTRLQQ